MTGTMESTRTLPFPAPPASLSVGVKNGCGGWRDEERKWHRCTTTDDKLYAQGRCLRCYSRQRRVVKLEGRVAASESPIFPRENGEEHASHSGEELRDAAHATAERDAPPVAEERVWAYAGPVEEATPPRDFGDAPGYDWTLFDQPPHTFVSAEPRVSINKDGDCRLNAAACSLFGREVLAVEILHDAKRRALALRPCKPTLPHARQLRQDKAARSCSLRAFRRATGVLRDGEACAVAPHLVGDLLVLDLP